MKRQVYLPGSGVIVVEECRNGHWVILEMRDATRAEKDHYRGIFK